MQAAAAITICASCDLLPLSPRERGQLGGNYKLENGADV